MNILIIFTLYRCWTDEFMFGQLFRFQMKILLQVCPLFWCLVKGVRELPYFKNRIFYCQQVNKVKWLVAVFIVKSKGNLVEMIKMSLISLLFSFSCYASFAFFPDKPKTISKQIYMCSRSNFKSSTVSLLF